MTAPKPEAPEFRAEMGTYSSVVGNSVHLIAPEGHFAGQVAILSQDHRLREKEAQDRLLRVIHDAINSRAAPGQDHRSFPDAADGRPLPPMGDELMIAGLNDDDARFVAIQLAQNGLMLARRADLSASPAQPVQEPVAWRWRPKGGSAWIYDPDPEWLSSQSRDEIEAEPVCVCIPTPAPQSDEAVTLRAELAEARREARKWERHALNKAGELGRMTARAEAAEAALQAEKDHADRLHSALAALKTIVGVARNDDEVDSSTQAGGWLCGDVMSDAYEDAVTAIAAHQARRKNSEGV